MLHSKLEWIVELTDSDYNLSLKELVGSGERITKSASAFSKDDSTIAGDELTTRVAYVLTALKLFEL